jgi:hypothetical protein
MSWVDSAHVAIEYPGDPFWVKDAMERAFNKVMIRRERGLQPVRTLGLDEAVALTVADNVATAQIVKISRPEP